MSTKKPHDTGNATETDNKTTTGKQFESIEEERVQAYDAVSQAREAEVGMRNTRL